MNGEEFIQLLKERKSIRKYTSEQISKEDLNMVIQAGMTAPSAGGAQKTIFVSIRNAELCKKIGTWNAACFDPERLGLASVSKEQPSIIDDPKIRNGFYGAPCAIAVFTPADFYYAPADTFCAAENMILMAAALGLASCIIGGEENTFESPEGKKLLTEWQIPEGWICRCYVLLGHIDGKLPMAKPCREGRVILVEEDN